MSKTKTKNRKQKQKETHTISHTEFWECLECGEEFDTEYEADQHLEEIENENE